MNIYVGNLSYQVTENTLRELFEEFGSVASVKIIMDKFTGKPKGFAFVEMETYEGGQQAIDNLNGKEFLSRTLKVNKALEKTSRPTR
ncbi:MAG: RNA-binding protein [bacterium]|nr:RNA-binding protein [bacterium]